MNKIQVRYGRHKSDDNWPWGWTYDAGEHEVGIGDIVLVPGTRVHPEPQEATVVALDGSISYNGPVTTILGVIE